MEDQSEQEGKPEPRGPFIVKGMQVSIPEGGLVARIGPDGPEFELKELHFGLDLCPIWLRIALDHLHTAKKARGAVLEADNAGEAERKADGLEAEFTAGMQAIMASTIALESYYATLTEKANLEKLAQTWVRNRKSAHARIAELMKRVFPIPPDRFIAIREDLEVVFGLRNDAVHPSAGATKPALHPELNQPMEWRFVTFRHENAKAVVRFALQAIAGTAGHLHQDKFEDVAEYCQTLMDKVEPLIERWETRYGRLFEQDDKGNTE